MNEQRQRRFRAAGIAGVAAGILIAVVGLVPTTVNADPPGNNGTVKIDGLDLNDGPGHSNKPNDPSDDGTDNDPHVTCGIQVEFFNFDTGQTADITFTAHAPTGHNGVLYDQNHVISTDGTGGADNDLDEVFDFDVLTDFDTTQFTSAHPVHGWHIKLNITVYDAEGQKVPGAQKHKVFWAEGSAPPCEDDPEELGDDCCVDDTATTADECCVDDPGTPANDCITTSGECVNDPATEADECNPTSGCVNDPATEADECNPECPLCNPDAEVLPEVVTPEPPTPAAETVEPPEVLGTVTLPVTGANTATMVGAAFGLILLGGALLNQSRRVTAKLD